VKAAAWLCAGVAAKSGTVVAKNYDGGVPKNKKSITKKESNGGERIQIKAVK